MEKYNITTKHYWLPPNNNLSRNNLSQGFNNNIYNTTKVEPLKSPSKAPQTSSYKQKSKKDIVDGIAALADNIYDENKKQRILDYIKDHHTTSKEIFDWLLNNQNSANSYIVLGDFHYLGIATMVDKRKAFDYYVQAANEESSVAQYTLGILCENDEKDTFQAMYWFDKSAKQGNQDAINNYYRLKSSKNKTFNPANLHSVMGKMNLGNENERKGFSLQDFKLPFV
jgi:TPR repeat protein